ncbi:hypothetical protein KR067_003694, partial [Drosophila pandora]
DLGERLNQLMLCVVCHEVPHPDKSYQCSVGHILCDDCVSHILADAAISNTEAQCPVCRVRMTWSDLGQNAVVRQALWELSKNCLLCGLVVTLKGLTSHLENDCELRRVSCRFRCLGCDWVGAYAICPMHEAGCQFPKMNGEEIQGALEKADNLERKSLQQAVRFLHELSQRRIFFRNLEIFWKTDWAMTNTERFLDSQSFEAYGNQWILRLRVSLSLDDIPVKVKSTLLLKVPPKEVITVRYLVLMPSRQGSDKNMQDILANLVERQYVAGTAERYQDLPMQSPMALYRLLAMQRIVLRLWMFM